MVSHGRPRPVSVSGVTHRRIGAYETRSVKGWAAAGAKKNGVFDNEEAATALIRFENGASMSVDISWAINGREGEDVLENIRYEGRCELQTA